MSYKIMTDGLHFVAMCGTCILKLVSELLDGFSKHIALGIKQVVV